VLVFHDVTERRRAQEALRESQLRNEFLANIIKMSSQPLGVGYPDGRLGLVNSAFEHLTGYSSDELQSIDWAVALTPPEWQPIERQKLEELRSTGKPVRYEKEYIRKDGSRAPIELLVHLVTDSDGAPEYYYSFLTDITERKQAEALLQRQAGLLIRKKKLWAASPTIC
jgi:PAS domain S-box-containing protein